MRMTTILVLLITMRTIKQKNGGFAALVSTIIISFILLVSVTSLAQFGLSGRFVLLDVERKLESEGLAEACGNVALIAIANDATFSESGVDVIVGDSVCVIVSVTPGTPSAGLSTADVKGVSDGATTNYRYIIATSDGNIISREELVHF